MQSISINKYQSIIESMNQIKSATSLPLLEYTT